MQFVKIMYHVFKELILYIYNQFLDNIKMKKLKINYENVKILFNIQQFIFKHI